MRERVTFVHDASDESFDAKQLRVEKSALQVTALRAAREEQLIFDVDEVPQEVIHIFSSAIPYALSYPGPPGLAAMPAASHSMDDRPAISRHCPFQRARIAGSAGLLHATG